MIAAIARRELGVYLRAPIALVVGLAFLVGQGSTFAALVDALSDPRQPAPLGAVLEGYFGGTLFHWTLQIGVIALLAMRVVAEEKRSGTWEVLLTAPVAEWKAIVGKWLGVSAFYLLLWIPTLSFVAVLAIFAPAGWTPEPAPIALAYLGEALIGLASLAVGIAWSASSSSQVLAGVGTFATLFAAVWLGESAWLDAETARWLSPRRQLLEWASGALRPELIVMPIALAVAALATAVAVEGMGRRRRPITVQRWLVSALCLVIGVEAAALIARADLLLDLSRGGRHGLDASTRAVLSRVEDKVTAAVVMPSIPGVAPIFDETQRTLRQMAAAQPWIEVKVIDPAGADLAPWARDAGVDATTLSRGGAVVLSRGERRRVVDLLDLAELGRDPLRAPTLRRLAAESALSTAIAELVEVRPLRVCATTGHGERPLAGGDAAAWTPIGERLRREAMTVEELVDVASGVPPRCAVLVVAGPRLPLSSAEAGAVAAYLDGAGALVLAVDRDLPTGLEAVLASYGLGLRDAIAVDAAAAVALPGGFRIVDSYGDDPITRGFAGRRLTIWVEPRVVAVAPVAGVAAAALASTSPAGRGQGISGSPDLEGPVAVAAVARDPRRGRVVVLGSAESFSADLLGRGLGAGDLLVARAIAALGGRRSAPVFGDDTPEQVRLVLTDDERRWLPMVCTVFVPLGFALLGLLPLAVRRWRR